MKISCFGRREYFWWKLDHVRNEALDTFVYALAALEHSGVDLGLMWSRIMEVQKSIDFVDIKHYSTIGATAYKYLRKDNLTSKIITPCRLAKFLCQAHFAGFLFKQIHTQMPKAGENRCTVVFFNTTSIITQNHIQSPMQRILDTSMTAHRFRK